MLSSPSFRRGMRDGLPIFFAVGSLGVAFGILALEAGFPWWIAVAASVIVVSGAAQFALVGLADAGTIPVLVATTGLALRHVPMSARLAALVGERPRGVRLALAWVLVDETFGLTLAASERGEDDLVAYKAAADALLYSGWVAGTAIGVVIGERVDPAAWGAEVFFALLFLGLAAPMVRKGWDALVALASVGAVLLSAELLPAAWQVTVAAAAAAAFGAVMPDE
jgi:predicted branched-subunit amino acid permease